jgi:hypothetical protein
MPMIGRVLEEWRMKGARPLVDLEAGTCGRTFMPYTLELLQV